MDLNAGFCANKRGPRPAVIVVDERSNRSSQRRDQKDRFTSRGVPVVFITLRSSQYATISHFVSFSSCRPIFLLPCRLRSKKMMNILDAASKYIHSDFLLDAVWVFFFFFFLNTSLKATRADLCTLYD